MAMPNPFARFNISDDWAAHRARGSLGGTDWSTPVGTPIYAPNPGQVTYEYGKGSGGYFISLALANSPGYVMQFLHCSAFEGGNRYVAEGELIGYTGGAKGAPGSGSSTGPHVHVHLVDPNGVREDVLPWFATTASPTSTSLTIDGDFGPRTKRALQSALGVSVDGDFGPASTRALQSFLGITADGSWGRATTRALQGFLGVTADGDFGRQTVVALQASLNAGTFKKVVPPVPKPVAPEPVKPEPVKPAPAKPAPVKPVETAPVKPEPVKPVAPKPTTPKPTKPKEKPLAEKLAHQQELATGLKVNDLGSIITEAKTRKIVWAVWTAFGLLLAAVMGGCAAIQTTAPDWVVFAMGVSLALQPAFGSLAIANINTKKDA